MTVPYALSRLPSTKVYTVEDETTEIAEFINLCSEMPVTMEIIVDQTNKDTVLKARRGSSKIITRG